jgi:outer membrane lipoprotein LolB
MPARKDMSRAAFILCMGAVLAACVTTRPPMPSIGWQQRIADLQHDHSWQLDGRAAAAVGTQGWQATLNWRQAQRYAEVHLSGPFGLGAVLLEQTPNGLSLNSAPPSDAVLAQVQDKLGFELPLDHLRFWLLGVPDPGAPSDVMRNDTDSAQQVTQAGWTVVYDRYKAVDGDVLPAHLVLSRDAVRVRIAIDQWIWTQ